MRIKEGHEFGAERLYVGVKGQLHSTPGDFLALANRQQIMISVDGAVHSCDYASIHTCKRIVFSSLESYNLQHYVREGVERSDVTAFSGRVQSCSPLAAII